MEILQLETHPFSATVGLRVEPAAPESGIHFRVDLDPRLLLVHIYKTADRQPVSGAPPTRPRSTMNPLDRDTCLARVARGTTGAGRLRRDD